MKVNLELDDWMAVTQALVDQAVGRYPTDSNLLRLSGKIHEQLEQEVPAGVLRQALSRHEAQVLAPRSARRASVHTT